MNDPKLDYTSRVYSALKDNLQGFDKTPAQFLDAMQDSDYRNRVYSALKDNLQGFNKSQDEFNNLVVPQKKNSGTSVPSKYVAAPDDLGDSQTSSSTSAPSSNQSGSAAPSTAFDPKTFMRQSRAAVLQNQPAQDNLSTQVSAPKHIAQKQVQNIQQNTDNAVKAAPVTKQGAIKTDDQPFDLTKSIQSDFPDTDPNQILGNKDLLSGYYKQKNDLLQNQINQMEASEKRGVMQGAINKLKTEQQALQQQVYYYNSIHAGLEGGGDPTKTGIILGKSMGDPQAAQQERYMAKGIPVNPIQQLNTERAGLDAQETTLKAQYDNDPQNPEYQKQLANIQNQKATILQRHPEALRQLWSDKIGEYIAKHLTPLEINTGVYGKSLTDYIADMRKDGINVPDEVVKNISWPDNLPKGFVSKLASGLTDPLSNAAAGIERIGGNILGVDKDVLDNDIQQGQTNLQNTYNLDNPASEALAGKVLPSSSITAGNIIKGIGNLASFVSGANNVGKVTENVLGKLAPEMADATSSALAQHIGTDATVFATSYEPNYQKAQQIIGDAPEDEGKRNVSAMINSMIDAAVFHLPIGKYGEQLSQAKTGLNDVIKDLPSDLKGLSSETLNTNLKKYFQKPLANILEAAGNTTNEAGKFGAMQTAGVLLKHISNSVIANNKESDNDWENVPSEIADEWKTLPVSLMPGIFGINLLGGMNASSYRKNAMYDAFANPQRTLSDLGKAQEAGLITPQEYAKRAEVINVGSKILNETPNINPTTGQPLTHDQAVTWVNNRLQEYALAAKKEGVKDDKVLSKFYDGKIKELQAQRENILTPQPTIASAIITINGKTYEGKNHAEAILKAKDDGQDISQVDRHGEGKFKLSDGTIIDREEAKKRFGQDRAELLIPQDDAAKQADKEYAKINAEPAEPVSSPVISENKEEAKKELTLDEKQQALVNELPKTKVNYKDLKGIGDLSVYIDNPEALNNPHLKSAKKIYDDIKSGKPIRDTPYVNENMEVMDGQNRIVAQLAAGIKDIDVAVIDKSFYDKQNKPISEPTNEVENNSDNKQKEVPPVEPDKIKTEEGKSGEIKFTEGVSVPFKYKLIEADDLQASHLASGERNPEHTIANAQPKERNDISSKNAQDKIADNTNLGEVGESPNPYFGAPVITPKGEVIQGNNRSIGLKKHYDHGGTSYKDQLLNNAEKFGLTKEQVEGMKNPVLVREVPLDDNHAVEFGNYDVKDLETGGKQRLDAIATVRKIKPEDKSKLASLIFDGDYKTIKESIRDNSKKVSDIIGKYINAAQRNTIIDKEGNITSKGMDDIESVVHNMVFDKGSPTLPEIFENLPSNIQKNIQKAIKNIFSVPEEKSLLSDLQKSMLALYEFQQRGAGDIDSWAKQFDLFKGVTPKDVFTSLELKLAQILYDAKTQSELSKQLARYSELVNGKPADMFTPETKGVSKAEGINKQFKVNYDEEPNVKTESSKGNKEALQNEGADNGKPGSNTDRPAENKPTADSGEQQSDKGERVKAGDVLRNFADIIEKGKISKLGGFKSSTGFDAIWDGSLTVVAETLRATGKLADAIEAGLNHIKQSDWYKNLTDKKDFDEKYTAHLEGEYGKFEKENPKEEPKEAGKAGSDMVGISHEALNDLAKKIGLPEIERGKSYDPKELADRGRKLLNAGADPNKIADEFYKDGSTDENGVSVVRAKIEQLFKTGEQISDKNSDSFKENFDQLAKFMQVEKDMGTFAHRIMKSFQGQRDIDTDSFVYVSMAAERKLGRGLNKEEKSKIDGLTKQVANLKNKVNEYEEKLKNAIDKDLNGESEPEVKLSISDKAKKIAAIIRKGKAHRPGVFSAATPASLVWDTAVETVAQVVEKGGALVDAIQKGVSYIKGTDWYKGLSEDKKKEAEDAFIKAHRDTEGTSLDSLQELLTNHKGDKFTPQEAKEIWNYAKKEYLNKGSNYLQMLEGVANDLGYTMTQVSKAIITPKTQRISDEMWKQRAELSKNRASVKRWLDAKGGNLALKAFRTAIDTFREAAVFGHGAIFIGTHAMPTFFDIPRAKYAIKGFFNAYKAAYGNPGNYALMIEDLKNSPNYLKAQRAGLQNNPERIGSDAEIISHHLKWFTQAGERGFNAIKILRQNLFDSHYNALPENLKQDPQVLKEIAQIINNATGATNAKVPNWMREATFAGGMEISRWERIVKNPAKAASILGKIATGDATPADKVFLRVWATRAGTIAGVYTSALIMNNALNAYLYPNDDKKRINFFNPSKGDWFKFKFGSVVIDPTSGMSTSIRFLTTIASMPFESEKYIKSHNQGDNRKNALAKKVLGYGLDKLSPGYTTIGELFLKHDHTGNTIPFSNDKPYYKSARKLDLIEYGEHKLPLPLAEGFEIYNDAAHEAGADNKTWNAYMKGIMFGGLSGLTGVRSYEDTKAAAPEKENTVVPYYHSPD